MWSEFEWLTMQNVLDGTIFDLYIVPTIETIKEIDSELNLEIFFSALKLTQH